MSDIRRDEKPVPHLQWDTEERCLVGRDPRELSPAELAGLGIERQPLLAAIRTKCIDCCCGSHVEVRRCGARGCALWLFRMGTNPFAGSRSLAQRGASLTNLARAPKNPPSRGVKIPASVPAGSLIGKRPRPRKSRPKREKRLPHNNT
jgi:hypothetical protein